MRKFFVLPIVMLALTGPALAQYQMSPAMLKQVEQMKAMTPEQQQQLVNQMKQKADEAQRCYKEAGADEAMKALQVKAQAVTDQIKKLCAAEKKDEAQAYALSAGKAMSADPTVLKLQQCMKVMENDLAFLNAGKPEQKHVCDQ